MKKKLKADCWNCNKPFHIQVEDEHYHAKTQKVERVVPCPYCGEYCKFELMAHQVPQVEITRSAEEENASEKNWLEDIPQEKLLELKFTTTQGEKEEKQEKITSLL